MVEVKKRVPGGSKFQDKNRSLPEVLPDYKFSNSDLLLEALTHRSYANEHPNEGVRDNERLEFLGDAVLGFVITDILVKKFESAQEGLLSRYRSDIVNEKRLAEIAKSIDLGSKLRFGKGENDSAGHDKDSILSGALEAVIAAFFLDGGYRVVYSKIRDLFEPLFKDIEKEDFSRDYKTRLQQHTQEYFKTKPVYRTVNEAGPDHHKTFDVEIVIDDEVRARAKGKSRKRAEQNAARMLFESLIKKS